MVSLYHHERVSRNMDLLLGCSCRNRKESYMRVSLLHLINGRKFSWGVDSRRQFKVEN